MPPTLPVGMDSIEFTAPQAAIAKGFNHIRHLQRTGHLRLFAIVPIRRNVTA